MGNRPIANHVFHDKASTTGIGKDYSLTGLETSVNLQFVIDTETTFTAEVYVRCVDSNKWYKYPFVKTSTSDLITNATINDASSLYHMCLSGASAVRVEITAISGEVTIYGKFVG